MKILFQGDSVTDAGRDRSNPHDMGEGYPRYASAMIQDSYPDTGFEFVNLGISGNRTADLVSRLESDFVDVQPDIVSVMIGINDVWHHYSFTYIETTDAEFEANLRLILTALRERTHARILLIQPVLLFGGTDEMSASRRFLRGWRRHMPMHTCRWTISCGRRTWRILPNTRQTGSIPPRTARC